MSKSLHTIVDVGDHHGPHGPKVYLQKSEIRTIMELVPNLKKVVTEGRVWTVRGVFSFELAVGALAASLFRT